MDGWVALDEQIGRRLTDRRTDKRTQKQPGELIGE